MVLHFDGQGSGKRLVEHTSNFRGCYKPPNADLQTAQQWQTDGARFKNEFERGESRIQRLRESEIRSGKRATENELVACAGCGPEKPRRLCLAHA